MHLFPIHPEAPVTKDADKLIGTNWMVGSVTSVTFHYVWISKVPVCNTETTNFADY